MKLKASYLFSAFLVIILLLIVGVVYSDAVTSSSTREFNVIPDTVFINWTTGYRNNITIVINETNFTGNPNLDNININVTNGTALSANYSQSNSLSLCLGGADGLRLKVRNASASAGDYTTIFGPMNGNDATYNNSNVSLIYDRDYIISSSAKECNPGRYILTRMLVRNYTNASENLNITVILDIPINTTNTLNTSGNMGSFDGTMPLNTTYNHTFFFNTSAIENATGLTINLTGWSSTQDLDVFLLDSSNNLKAKSINKTGTTEWLIYNFLDYVSPAMWKILLFGNSSSSISYRGNIFFTTLNATNASAITEQVTLLNFTVKNVSDNSTINVTLKNEGSQSINSVTESKNFYYVKRFTDSGNENITFLVPYSGIATKVKATVNWTGGTNYSFNLYNQTDDIVARAVDHYVNANKGGVMQEILNETTSIPITAGLWKLEVKNSTTSPDIFTATVYIYVSESSWIATNYSTFNFNGTGGWNNSNVTVAVNLSTGIPSTAMDGLYEGNLYYLNTNNTGIYIPIAVNVTTPMLVVNNTLDVVTFRIDENPLINQTRNMTFNLANMGSQDLIINITHSSFNLSCNTALSSCSGYNGSFVFNSSDSGLILSGYNLPAQSNTTINLNLTFNSSMPVGIYDGWIKINGTNSTAGLASHPYQIFTATIRLNITNALHIDILQLNSSEGNDPIVYNNDSKNAENITVRFKVYYANKTTEIEGQNSLPISNMSIWLQESNTSYRIPTIANLSISNGTNPMYLGGDYEVNATVPASKPGGIYRTYIQVNYTNRSIIFIGIGVNSSLILNNTGLNMTVISYPSSMNNLTTTGGLVNVSVNNYGPVAATSAKIKLTTGSCINSIYSNSATAACSAAYAGGEFTITVPAYNTSSCYVSWTLKSAGTSTTCTSVINGTAVTWFSDNSFSTTVSLPSGSTPTTPAAGATGTTTTTTVTTTTTTTTIPIVTSITNISTITPSSPVTIAIPNSETLKVQQIVVAVKNTVTNVAITVKESSQPLGAPNITAPENGAVFKYLDISAVNMTANDIANITIRFQVDKTWIDLNSINEGSIALYRYYNSSWSKLDTKKVNDTATVANFEAISFGLSVFAIAGEKSEFPWFIIIVSGAVLLVVFAFLFWPTKIFKPKEGQLPKPEKKEEAKEGKVEKKEEKPNTWEELEKKWKELTEKEKK